MKIGYLLQQGFDLASGSKDGPANHVSLVVSQLHDLDHQVRVVMAKEGAIVVGDACEGDDLFQWSVHEATRDAGLCERAVRKAQRELSLPYLNIFDSRRFARACRLVLDGFDVLLERLSWTGYGGSWAAQALDIPHVLEYNGDPLLDLEAKGLAPEGIQLLTGRLLMHRNLDRASLIVASGDGWRQQLLRRWKLPDQKVVTVHNGTNLVRLLSRSELKVFGDQMSQGSAVRFVYLGGFQPWQGVDVLLSAFKQVRERLPKSTLWLIGDGPGLNQSKELAGSLGLGASVDFAGALAPEEYAHLLARADVGVSPYCGWPEYEGLKLFDYKAAGLPIISSGEGEMPSTITSGPVGCVVPPCDEPSLASAMIEMAERDDWRREMGRKARLEAETCHDWRHTAIELASVLEDVVGA